MQMPWFGRFTHRRDRDCVMPAPRHRSDDEVALALSTLPLYRVVLTPSKDDGGDAATLIRSRALTCLVGQERAARILAETARTGAGLIVICPRELAEHYRDELARYALPCAIEPA